MEDFKIEVPGKSLIDPERRESKAFECGRS